MRRRAGHLRQDLRYFSLSLAATACMLCPSLESHAADNSTVCDLFRYQFADRVEPGPHLIRWAGKIKFFLAMPSRVSEGSSESASGSPINRILGDLDNIPPAISAFGLALYDVIETPNTPGTEARNQKEANAVVRPDQVFFSLQPLELGERRVLFPSGPTFDKRCVLQMTLKGDVIQTAEIDLRSGITETQTANCMRELMWRAYGFVGRKEDNPNAGNAVGGVQDFLPDRKKKMLTLLYDQSLKEGMSRSQAESALKIAGACY